MEPQGLAGEAEQQVEEAGWLVGMKEWKLEPGETRTARPEPGQAGWLPVGVKRLTEAASKDWVVAQWARGPKPMGEVEWLVGMGELKRAASMDWVASQRTSLGYVSQVGVRLSSEHQTRRSGYQVLYQRP